MASILGKLPDPGSVIFQTLPWLLKTKKTPKSHTSNSSLWTYENPVETQFRWTSPGGAWVRWKEYPVGLSFCGYLLSFWPQTLSSRAGVVRSLAGLWLTVSAHDQIMDFDGGLVDHPLSTASPAGLWSLLPCFEDFSLPFCCVGAVFWICCLYVPDLLPCIRGAHLP